MNVESRDGRRMGRRWLPTAGLWLAALTSLTGPVAAGITTLESRSSGEVQGDQESVPAPRGLRSVSADGRLVVFSSVATNLVDGDSGAAPAVYVRDRVTGTTTLVSVATGGEPADGSSYNPTISANGRHVAFESFATNLAPGVDESPCLYLHDRLTGETRVVDTHAPLSGGPVEAHSSHVGSLSDDGRYVAYKYRWANSSTGAAQETVCVRDMVAGTVTEVAGLNERGSVGAFPSLSADGNCVGYALYRYDSPAHNNLLSHGAYVRDLAAAKTIRVDVSDAGTGGNQMSESPALSYDGRYAAFASLATNLVAGDTNARRDVFVRDRTLRKTTRVSLHTGGAQPNADCDFPGISADARYVAFMSRAGNLVGGDTNAVDDVFVHDRVTRKTTRVSVSSLGAQGNGVSALPSISPTGRYLAFFSQATNLVGGDINAAADVFVHDQFGSKSSMFSSTTPGDGDTVGSRYGPVTVTFAWPVVQGTAEPRFTLTPLNGSPVSGEFAWPVPFLTMTFTPDLPLPPATLFTAQLGGGVRKKDGTTLTTGEGFSFTTTDGPVVADYYPRGNVATDGAHVSATFDQAMNRSSVQSNLTVEPFVPGFFTWAGNTFTFRPKAPLTDATTYTVTIGAGAQSAAGTPMGVPFVWQFQTVAGMLATHLPLTDQTLVARNTPIGMTFNWPMNRLSAETHFSLLDPAGVPVTGTFEWLTPKLRLRFYPAQPLAVNRRYWVRLSTGISRLDGTPVDCSQGWSFLTTTGPAITDYQPRGTGVSRLEPVVVTFDQDMNKTSAEGAFAMTPAVAGTFAWNGRLMVFEPNAALAAGTTYTAEVKQGARSLAGVALGRDFTWTFTTEGGASAALSVSAAAAPAGAGAQVTVSLSAAGTVGVGICNVAGRTVALLPEQKCQAGVSTLVWNGRSTTGTPVPPGAYLVRVTARREDGGQAQALTSLRLGR